MDRAAGIIIDRRKIQIHPYPDKRIGYVKASYDSPYGEIYSSWEFVNESLKMEVRIPPNTEAEVFVPDGRCFSVGSGRYTYEAKI